MPIMNTCSSGLRIEVSSRNRNHTSLGLEFNQVRARMILLDLGPLGVIVEHRHGLDRNSAEYRRILSQGSRGNPCFNTQDAIAFGSCLPQSVQ